MSIQSDTEYIENLLKKTNATKRNKSKNQLPIKRLFTKKNIHPYDEIEWEFRDSQLMNEKGEIIFEQKNIEVPKKWSVSATNIVASKYLNGPSHNKENSIKKLIDRVANTISDWGLKKGYFGNLEIKSIFENELKYILVNQYAAFNSPVWFNCGIEEKPQCSACFINSVEDDMESILDLAKTEGMLFKWGSGSGVNLSAIRSSKEILSGGGKASGPISFMKGFDSFAGAIKSGGKTRRAAKMVILNIEHPDILEFIECKANEEKKAWALIDAGYDGSFNGEAYQSIFFQNANNSVRISDDFMEAVLNDQDWHTRAVKDNSVMDSYSAQSILDKISEAAHLCGDPGIQFDTTINNWHTCLNSGKIEASNPCSEYMFLNNSACNLSSLNLLKFLNDDHTFNVESFRHAVHLLTIAMDIIVSNAGYPTPQIAQNSELFRPLGLGYANLGALLMNQGLPYDSPNGRDYAATITAILTGQAYLTSSIMAKTMKPFSKYPENKTCCQKVLKKHQLSLNNIKTSSINGELFDTALEIWDEVITHSSKHGLRNSQVSVLAPTGTIGFMMDCDTTGIEPDLALVKYKSLVGGGSMKIINHSIKNSLIKLDYTPNEINDIVEFIHQNDTIEGAPHLKENHLNIYDCAFKPFNGKRFIHYMGHIRMMSAVQPFISGAISKTVNLPKEATSKDIKEVFIQSWKLGLKAITIYRDGSKRIQPLNTSKNDSSKIQQIKYTEHEWNKRRRKRLPDERPSITHKFKIGGHEGYIHVGLYENNLPGEIFIDMSKEGSIISGLMDSFATSISLALQYGVPLQVLVDKFSHMRFEPSGITNNSEIRFAKSIVDYIFRWMENKFIKITSKDRLQSTLINDNSAVSQPELENKEANDELFQAQTDAPPCADCGSIMVRSGSCYKCLNCGSTSGCS